MRSHLKQRVRGHSISTVVPSPSSPEYSAPMSKAATSILYRSPLPSPSGLPIYILNAAALPDTHEVDYDTLLPYVLARLPGEEELVSGAEYEVIFFAGGPTEGATSTKKNHPGLGWSIQAYHVLSRAMRKRIQKLYIVHQRTWVRMLVEMFSTIASPKFRKKIVHGRHYFRMHVASTNLQINVHSIHRCSQANRSTLSLDFECSSTTHTHRKYPNTTISLLA
jgi:Rho GTPase-activating protein 1